RQHLVVDQWGDVSSSKQVWSRQEEGHGSFCLDRSEDGSAGGVCVRRGACPFHDISQPLSQQHPLSLPPPRVGELSKRQHAWMLWHVPRYIVQAEHVFAGAGTGSVAPLSAHERCPQSGAAVLSDRHIR